MSIDYPQPLVCGDRHEGSSVLGFCRQNFTRNPTRTWNRHTTPSMYIQRPFTNTSLNSPASICRRSNARVLQTQRVNGGGKSWNCNPSQSIPTRFKIRRTNFPLSLSEFFHPRYCNGQIDLAHRILFATCSTIAFASTRHRSTGRIAPNSYSAFIFYEYPSTILLISASILPIPKAASHSLRDNSFLFHRASQSAPERRHKPNLGEVTTFCRLC